MKNFELNEFDVVELNNDELKQNHGGGYGWFWQAAAATFIYNTVADWKENVAAFEAGQAAY